MELPDILDKITHPQEKPVKEYFWALQIWSEGVKSAIWVVEDQKAKVSALGSREPWSGGADELLLAVDHSFSKAMERFLEPGEEPSRVILGLPDDWSDEAGIKSKYQELLSTLRDKLEIKIIGFVSLFDAINHHLKEVEGAPVSAILVNPGQMEMSLAVLEVGKIIGVEKVVRSENLANDVCEGLSRFSAVESFPSRMLLFDGENMEEAQQALIAYNWQSTQESFKNAFLHFPKIEILPLDFDITSVALSGGKEVAKSLGISVTGIEEKVEAEKEEAPAPEEPADFGFLKGEDIAATQPRPPATPLDLRPEEPVLAQAPIESPAPKAKAFFSNWQVPAFSLPSLPGRPKGFVFLGILATILLVLALGLGLLWWQVSHAQVVLSVNSQPWEKETELTVDPNQEKVDVQNLVLPASLIEVEVGGEQTTATTGEKTVGDKSKGEVTIFNRTDSRKVFAEGAILVGPGNLKFTLDRETTVASKTPDLSSGVDKWGEAKTGVTAVDIGAQYNLASSSQFVFKDFPQTSFLAKNDAALTGGTSRQIQAVAEKDQKDLLAKLTAEIVEKGKTDLLLKVPAGKKLAEGGILTQAVTSDFDHKIGDEAQTLALNLRLKVTGLTFTDEDLAAITAGLIEGSIPTDYQLKKEEITSVFELKKKNDDGSMIFKVLLKANLLPKIDEEKIKREIMGKYENLAKSYLSGLPGYADAEINIWPPLPGLLGTIPRRIEKITLEIRSR